jgi:hypothetical protein
MITRIRHIQLTILQRQSLGLTKGGAGEIAIGRSGSTAPNYCQDVSIEGTQNDAMMLGVGNPEVR